MIAARIEVQAEAEAEAEAEAQAEAGIDLVADRRRCSISATEKLQTFKSILVLCT